MHGKLTMEPVDSIYLCTVLHLYNLLQVLLLLYMYTQFPLCQCPMGRAGYMNFCLNLNFCCL